MQIALDFPPPGEIKKSPAVIHSKTELTFMEKKISNVLFENAYEDLTSERVHSIPVSVLKRKCEYDSNDSAYFKEAIENLQSKRIKYDIFDEYGKETGWGVGSIISWVHVHHGKCEYEYPQKLAELMSDPERYVRINLEMQNLITSGHTYTIYELCSVTKGLLAKRKTVYSQWYPLPVLHEILGTTKKKTYQVYGNLKRYILDKAVAEINSKTELAITFETRKEGRSVVAIRFLIEQNQTQALAFIDSDTPTQQPALIDSEEYKKVVEVFKVTDKAASKIFKKHDLSYIQEKIALTEDAIRGGAVSRPAGYFVKAINDDYRSPEAKVITIEPTPVSQPDLRVAEQEKLMSQIETEMFKHESCYADEAKESYLATLSDGEKAVLLKEVKSRVKGSKSLDQISVGFVILEKIQGYDEEKSAYLAGRRAMLEKRMEKALAAYDRANKRKALA